MADLVDGILAQYGCGPEIETPDPAGPFNGAAEHHRRLLIAKLERAKAAIEILVALISIHGNTDAAFEAQAQALDDALVAAGDDYARFRSVRECRGLC